MTQHWLDRRFEIATALLLAGALALGGAASVGYFGRLLVQLATLPLLWVAFNRLAHSTLTRETRIGLILLGSILALPLLQLIPLPPALWTGLPGREAIASVYAAMAVEPGWLGISLSPDATLTSWLALLPAAAIFVAVLTLPEEARLRLCLVVLAIALVSVLIGSIQVSGGGARVLYFYRDTNVGSAVGFFSNRNHLATLLVAAIPLLSLLFRSAGRVALDRPAVLGRRIAVLALASVLVMGVLLTGSRAGLVLLIPALLLTYAATMRSSIGVPPLKLIAAVLLVGIATVAVVVYGPFYERIVERTSNLDEEARVWAAPITAAAGWAHFPFGSGFGTFDPVFRAAAGDAHLSPAYVNHAHNDYLELWLTGGLPAMLLLLVVLWWGGRLAISNWRLKPGNPSAISRAASIVVLLILLHSVVDYPVRTVAISSLFALACGLQFVPLLPKGRALAIDERPPLVRSPLLPMRSSRRRSGWQSKRR